MFIGDGKKKSKKKWIIIGIVGGIFPLIILLATIGSGMASVASLFSETEKVLGEYPTSDELLAAVSDGSIITDDMMEGWMLNRETMIYMLRRVTDYNSREPNEKVFSVEVKEYWWEPVATPTPIPTPTPSTEEKGDVTPTPIPDDETSAETTPAPTVTPTPTPEPEYEYKENYYYTDISIREDASIIQQYKLDWQLVYLMCVYDAIDNKSVGTSGGAGASTVNVVRIDEIIESLKPRYEYEFNPIDYWKRSKPKLSLSDVSSHPHNTIQYAYTTLASDIEYNVYYYTPKMVIKKVTLPWKEDTYVMGSDGTYMVTTEYKADMMMEILRKYLGSRDVDIFLDEVDMMPGGTGLGQEIRKALKESGYEI